MGGSLSSSWAAGAAPRPPTRLPERLARAGPLARRPGAAEPVGLALRDDREEIGEPGLCERSD